MDSDFGQIMGSRTPAMGGPFCFIGACGGIRTSEPRGTQRSGVRQNRMERFLDVREVKRQCASRTAKCVATTDGPSDTSLRPRVCRTAALRSHAHRKLFARL